MSAFKERLAEAIFDTGLVGYQPDVANDLAHKLIERPT